MLTVRDPANAAATIVDLKHDADEALETLWDLARGIYPPLLADKGLAAALRSQAGKATRSTRPRLTSLCACIKTRVMFGSRSPTMDADLT
jgi:signal transduction histidine kinase